MWQELSGPKRLINKWADLERIFEGVEKLVSFPDLSNVKSLVNRPEYRLRVGRYRVIFTVNGDGAVTVILIEEVKKRVERTY